MKLNLSLQTKYLFLIIGALLAVPFFLTVVSMAVFLPFFYTNPETYNHFYNSEELEDMWHHEASELAGAGIEEINHVLQQLKSEYKEAGMFWVNEQGLLQEALSPIGDISKNWTAQDSISFMKRSYDADPFTVVAFIGQDESQGFMVLQMPREYLDPPMVKFQDRYGYLYYIVALTLLIIFLLISWLYFRGIRKRLVRLQKAMEIPSDSSIPELIEISKSDEIGELEQSFNEMVVALQESREKEQKELKLRQELIANLSHDLRTPLTVLRGNLYSLKKETQTTKSTELIEIMDDKISYIADLIENLLSYTLLTSGKYPYHPQQVNITRLLRTHLATWYSVFEEEGFEVDIDLPEEPIYWEVDEKWMKRIVDNILQNVIRYASVGKYVKVVIHEGQLIFEDRGQGMHSTAGENKGTGIGLTIISMMIKEMNMNWKIDSNEHGTKMIFSPSLK
ncbi:HAMP domain-containing sensor histidine kinase [Bacillus sp. AK128]